METAASREIEPRMSVNQLVKCSTASPDRFDKIVDGQKNPGANKPRITWYDIARRKIIQFLEGDCLDKNVLEDESRRLSGLLAKLSIHESPENDRKRIRIQGDIDAMDAFLEIYRELEINGVRFVASSYRLPTLFCAGVHISVRPEIFIRTRNYETVGCLKLYLSRRSPLSEEDGKFLCGILHHFAAATCPKGSLISPEACIAIDVLGKRIFHSSERDTLQAKKIYEICEKVRRVWQTIPLREPVYAAANQGEFSFSA